uniref:HUA enhancer 2 n=1 Tax=Dunaliella salina TaxID=3046 RepID=A0ABQ7GPW6_DUNSA
MELSQEGLAAAKETREAAARKRNEQAAAADAKEKEPKHEDKKAKPSPRVLPHVSHEVAFPAKFDRNKTKLDAEKYGTFEQPHIGPQQERAKQYPFTLDPFQETAVACLERRESVLVSAHTSAGKTVVAEYAIAMAFRDKQRVIYTSPLKALSNQKFRGSELMREVAWVVFDEIHYMQDRERGVVWEETIIFLPDECKMVFLSATLANASEFAHWIAHLHSQPCHVVYTDYSPTPLQHYAYALGGSGMHMILDERGVFRSEAFAKVRATFQMEGPDAQGGKDGGNPEPADGPSGRGRGGRGDRGRGGRGRGGGRGGHQDKGGPKEVGSILNAIKKMNWEPAIFFAFSRKECELYAGSLKTFDFNPNPDDKASVNEVFNNAVQCLSEEDRALPPIEKILPMLQVCIGVHHSGLLPILKEVIEILFQEGLIKVLFATETFAMGLNMPARTVVFTALRKWDGIQNRLMSSGEYIQMSGRAGRRGKDDKGICIMMVTEDVDETAARAMCMGKPSPLLSSFRLSYYTMLNMLRRLEGGDSSMEYVIKHSFQQFQQERQMPQVEAQLSEVESQMASLGKEGEDAIRDYLKLRSQIAEQSNVIRHVVLQPQHSLQFLRAGRIVSVQDGQTDWGYGVIVSVMRRGGGGATGAANGDGNSNGVPLDGYIADTLLVCNSASLVAGEPVPAKLGEPGAEMVVVPMALELVASISALRISIPPDLRPADARRSVLLQLQLRVYDFFMLVAQARDWCKCLNAAAVFQAERDQVKFKSFAQRAALAERAETLRTALRTSYLSAFKEEAKQRTAVLKRLGHVDEEGVVLLKGQAACEIDTADELLTAELMFNGTLIGLDKHQLVALVSCLIPVEKSGEAIKLTQVMAEPLASLQETARYIAEVSRECKLEMDPDAYVESFRPFLMDIMYSWSKGASFAEICGITDIYEGSIIRATRRLDELLQQLARAARVVGDEGLAFHIEDANLTIRRDIIFAASLYI